MLWVLWTIGALAGRSDDAATRQAEVRRLGDEMARLMERGAWRGVERAYGRALQVDADVPASMHLAAARASAHRGDAEEAKSRLFIAYELDPQAETEAWLFTYVREYSRVKLRADKGAELQVERRHFDNQRALVVDAAARELAKSGSIDTLLPKGRYRVGAFWFTVVENGPDIVEDLRSCLKTASCKSP